MIVGDFNFVGMRCFPAKTDPVLVVNPNTEESPTIAPQSLQAIPGRISQLPDVSHAIDLVELATRDGPDGGTADAASRRAIYAIKEIFRTLISKRPYHA